MKQGQYPNAFYRVSAKAVILNQHGEVLVVREGKDWALPGGGIDHGEDPLTALKRELYEETLIDLNFNSELIGTESFYVKSKDAMALWMIYRLTMINPDFIYKAGKDVDEVSFRRPADFENSDSLFEQFIYKYGLGITN
jgi:8-oxo-dGTP pyrophosphatase MutT (NUDIX family)